MRKAFSVLEYVLLGTLVCVISIGGFIAFNQLKLKLTGMSTVNKSETAGTIAQSVLTNTDANIDNCVTKSNGKCAVFNDKNGNPFVYKEVEVAGTNAKTYQVVYLNAETKASSLDECIGQLAMGARVCYDKKGNKVECEKDKNGNIISWTQTNKKGEVVKTGTTSTSVKTEQVTKYKKVGNVVGYITGTKTTTTITDENGTIISTNSVTDWDFDALYDENGDPIPLNDPIPGSSGTSGSGGHVAAEMAIEQY